MRDVYKAAVNEIVSSSIALKVANGYFVGSDQINNIDINSNEFRLLRFYTKSFSRLSYYISRSIESILLEIESCIPHEIGEGEYFHTEIDGAIFDIEAAFIYAKIFSEPKIHSYMNKDIDEDLRKSISASVKDVNKFKAKGRDRLRNDIIHANFSDVYADGKIRDFNYLSLQFPFYVGRSGDDYHACIPMQFDSYFGVNSNAVDELVEYARLCARSGVNIAKSFCTYFHKISGTGANGLRINEKTKFSELSVLLKGSNIEITCDGNLLIKEIF